MRNQWFKCGPIMLAAFLSVNFLAAQAQAELITGKGAVAPPPDLASVQGIELPDLPEPLLEKEWEWINDLAMGKGCRGRGVAEGPICSYGSIVPPPDTFGALGLTSDLGPDGASSVPVPGTLVLLGLGLASLGAARRRR